MDPQILLLDEVTSALDPEVVVDVLEVLRNVAATTDVTMLIVTHEMSFARDVSHRVMMFDGGKVVESAGPDHFHQRRRNGSSSSAIGRAAGQLSAGAPQHRPFEGDYRARAAPDDAAASCAGCPARRRVTARQIVTTIIMPSSTAPTYPLST